MKHFLKEYFYFTRTERKGALVLALLCVLAFLLPRVYPLFLPVEKEVDFSAYQEAVASFTEKAEEPNGRPPVELFSFDPNTISKDSLQLLGLPARVAQNIINYRRKVGPFANAEELGKVYTLSKVDLQRIAPYVKVGAHPKKKRHTKQPVRLAKSLPAPFPFNPNLAGEEELRRLGLPERVVHNMVKYREKGGRFYKAEELKKIYGISEKHFDRLLPFVRLSEGGPALKAEKTGKEEAVPTAYGAAPPAVVVDINEGAAADWQALRGIGPAYARRIIKFREALGGFASIDQVGETYGLPDSTFQQIRSQLRFSGLTRTIKINEWGAKQLRGHPYLNWKQANAIVNYRNNHGYYQNLEDVRKVRALPQAVIDKLAPYLAY